MKRRRGVFATAFFVIWCAIASRAGGPAFVAGSGYLPGIEGLPLVWLNGSVQYFTDQGGLSPILTNAQADSLVAAAFSTWTSVAGVSLTATEAGHLAEDVNGANIAATVAGVVIAPADITASATTAPVAIVYDADGTVTDALFGQGAGGLEDCFTNAVYGVADNFSTSGNIVHALVIINGVCASSPAQLPDVQYRLVRVLGSILGLGWSQANVNVLTQSPAPTAADYAGFPAMHYSDPVSCVPISICFQNAAVPKMDDVNALARLYPAGASPQLSGRIFGSVYFTDASGNAMQPMQGVNVVARLIATGQPSRQSVVTSVSGFAFHGNAGNIVLGYTDANGLRYDRVGSADPALEGFFDLGQLPIPQGQTIAEYQLSVEPLDANWSLGVEPYATSQVAPSGSFAPVVVTIQSGSNVERDILLSNSEIVKPHPGSGSTYVTPAVLPQDAAWGSWISGYGSTDWFEFTAQGNRTASISATAIDEMGNPTENKLLPIIGVWQLSDTSGNPAPASTPFAFNTQTFGVSRLDVQFGALDNYRIGVSDLRGDGRPDYFYQANLLYADTVTPARVSVAGGIVNLNGIGFNPRQRVTVGALSGATLFANSNRIEASLPAAALDGVATIQVTDPANGGLSQMIGALTYGAAATDLLQLVQGSESATPVGGTAPAPIRVRVVTADGITPVGGATIAWSATNGLTFSACNGLNSCSVRSDETGEAATMVTPVAVGLSTITASLAPATYLVPQTQQASVVAVSTSLDLSALNPTRWIAQGASLSTPLSVIALNLGTPRQSVPINFSVVQGTASLSAATATTNALGAATVTASVTNQQATALISACVAPANAPCQTFTLFATPSSLWKLETVNGSSQSIGVGGSFQPLVMRITDGSVADNPVTGVAVTFVTTLAQINLAGGQTGLGEQSEMPVILGSSQVQIITTQNGLATIIPSASNVGLCDVFVSVSAGSSTAQFQFESLAAIVLPQSVAPAQIPAQRNQTPARVISAAPVLQSVSPILFAVPQIGTGNAPLADSPESPDNSTPVTEPLPGDEAVPTEEKLPEKTLSSQISRTKGDDVSAASGNQSKPKPALAKKVADPQSKIAGIVTKPIPAKASVAPPNRAETQADDKRSCRRMASDGMLP
jgi:hypothetical protein